MKIFRPSALWAALLLLQAVPLFAQAPNFERLKARFDNGEVFKAEFRYVYYDSYTTNTDEAEGTIWIAREAYKLRNGDKTLIVNGETSQTYERDRNRVIINEYVAEDDDFAPSRMLSGVDSTYTVTETTNDDGVTVIRLVTDDEFALYTEVTIRLDRQGRPASIIATDFAENEITTSFFEGAFITPGESTFVLGYPDNAEIIDTRY